MRASVAVSALLLVPAAAHAQHAQHAQQQASQPSGARASAVIPVRALMSAPFASGLVGSAGGRFAWAVAHEGARSIYVADAATARATRVAHWAADDGQELGDISLSRDGRVVAFVRGQGFNRLRENPNPTSDAEGAEQAVWVSVNGAPPRRVGQGWAPRVSPNGEHVVFQRDSTLMLATIDDPRRRATPRPVHATVKPLFRGRGVNQDARWSPGSDAVAFTSNRGTHSFVGVVDVADRAITWMSPGTDRDAEPRWSPDGKRLLFVRSVGGGGQGVAMQAQGGGTFAFHVADPATGTARELWKSARGARLFAPGVEPTLAWAGSRIVFGAELDGWHHLHVLDASAERPTPRALTSGKCEVDGAAVTPDGATVHASTNCVDKDTADVDRKHLWKLDATGRVEPVQVTKGHHIEFAPVMAGSRVAYLESEPHLPAFARLLAADGMPQAVAGQAKAPATYPAHEAMVMPRQVVFTSADGTPVHGQLFVPHGAGAAGGAKRPAVIFMHGGPVRQMLLGYAPRGYYSNAYAFNQHLASRGYVVLSVNYRGGIGYGRAFREPPKLGARGAIEYEDVVAGAKFLQQHAAVDPQKIGLWGGSYGGYLTALGMGRNPELFKAGVDLHGVHDWFAHYRQMGRAVNVPPGAAGDSTTRVARESSPVCCVERIAGPLLLVHGDDDRNVPFEQTTSFVELLRRHGKPHEVLVLPDEIHGFLRHASWVRVFEASAGFLDRHLAGTGEQRADVR